MILHVTLFDGAHVEPAHSYTVKVRGLDHAIRMVPRLLAAHKQTRDHYCAFDRCSFSGRLKPDALYRVIATGAIVDGLPVVDVISPQWPERERQLVGEG